MTRTALLSALVACSLAVAGTAMAQSKPGNDDLRALRYYLQHNETVAIEAEMERLKARFPGWTPPANLLDLAQRDPSSAVSEIYARLGRGDVDGAARMMERVKAGYPEWTPPTALINELKLAEGQLQFDRAVSARDTATAVRIGTRMPALFRCDRINNAWNLAELQAASGSASRALTAYSQIVRTCTSISELVATIEKAEAVTTDAQLVGLTDTAKKRFPAHAATFDKLTQRLMSGRGRGTVRTAAVPARKASVVRAPKTRPTKTQTVPASRVTAPEPVVQAPVAIPSYGGPKLASLPRTGDNRLAQTRAAKETGNFRDCLARSSRPRSLDIAYERAWCAYSTDRSLEALAYFSAAAQAGLGGNVPRDARFGMTLSLLKHGMVDDAAEIAARTDLTLQQRKEVEIIILDRRGVNAFNEKEYQQSINYFDALEQVEGSLRRDLAMLRGYAYLRLGERQKARDQFQILHDVLATPETRKALASTH